MFKNIDTATQAVMLRRNKTYGIDNLLKLLDLLKNPQDDLMCIHIGGTNGKGSTTNYTRSILQTAGYRVGTFTSPHLITHSDRICIDNKPISDNRLLAYINETVQYWETYDLSMFEIDMLISIWYFRDEAVDWVVYEVGLGGRLDATNVIKPRVCAITNVGLDHQDILGDTVTAIATEKVGILKTDLPLITTAFDRDALAVMVEKVHQTQSRFKQICIPYYTIQGKQYQFYHENIKLTLENQGSYQVGNAALAVSIIHEIIPDMPPELIQEGVRFAKWPGRFEEVITGLYIDGAHNAMGVEGLIESLHILPRPWTIVFTALKDKDFHGMINVLEENADEVVITSFDFYRAARAEALAKGHDVHVIEDTVEALNYAMEKRQEGGTVVITGSLYFISEARAYIIEKGKHN